MTPIFATCCDSRYFPYALTLARSLDEQAQGGTDFHIFKTALTDADRARAASVAARFRHLRITTHDMAELTGDIPRLTGMSYLTPEAYARLYLPGFFKDLRTAVIYLDPDIIAIRPYARLLELASTLETPAATPDYYIPLMAHRHYLRGRFEHYYNSGVLVMPDTDACRRIFADCVAALRQGGLRLVYADQDVLNHVAADRITPLGIEFNYSENTTRYERLFNEPVTPVLIHFTGGTKPWMWKNRSSHRGEFRAVAARAGLSLNERTGWFTHLRAKLGAR